MESQTTSHETHLYNNLIDNAQIWRNFIGTDGWTLKIQTTNAQEIYNHYQNYETEQVLVIDFRSK
jgi:hypothetical protein